MYRLEYSRGRARYREPRPEHKAHGDPCRRCGIPESEHRVRECRGARPGRLDKTEPPDKKVFIGIDGEGQGRKDHRYVLLAAATEDMHWSDYIEASPGDSLTTEECLEFLLSLPVGAKVFSYSFNYDLTKMLTDLDNESLYMLFRPGLRQRTGKKAFKGPLPVKWPDPKKGPYALNLQGTKFTVIKYGRHRTDKPKRRVIWDIFKFFGCSFVNALEDWHVGHPRVVARMALMKAKRSEFDKETRQAVRDYCFEECQCMAELSRKLLEAHNDVGLKLKSYYGAGSSGGAMLTAMGIKDQVRDVPPEMFTDVACAFFGGRFENSVIGSIPGYLYGKDISSAYPYQTTFLPCLTHGKWEKVTDFAKAQRAKHALIHYDFDETADRYKAVTTHGTIENHAWGPFPFRSKEGSISFPLYSGGGWVWNREFFIGKRIFPHVRFREAWVYTTKCKCQPFEKIPEYYRARIGLGKEGPGIVIKLGVNSCYGKLAQSVGSAVFNNWIWAGMITSGCRAQILELMWLHKDLSNLLMIATDGIITREKIASPVPRDTGTWECNNEHGAVTKKPLGGWEDKDAPRGMFMARPGIYFPLEPSHAIDCTCQGFCKLAIGKDGNISVKDVKGRGVGRGTMLRYWKVIVEAWESRGDEMGGVKVANVVRFCGAKTSISYAPNRKVFTRAKGKGGPLSPNYGQWIEREVEMSFDPMPKRECVNHDGVTLKVREFGDNEVSTPYKQALKSQEAKMLARAQLEQEEQPEGELQTYEG